MVLWYTHRSLLELIGEKGKKYALTPAQTKKKLTHQRDYSLKVRFVWVYVVGRNTRNKNKIKLSKIKSNRGNFKANKVSSEIKVPFHLGKMHSE
jgi:hypothetical protein